MNKIQKNFKNQLSHEKRKRFLVYKGLDYLLSKVSYFDFLSLDTFQILTNAKYLAQIYNRKTVTSEDLLQSFSFLNSDFSKLLESFDLYQSTIKKKLNLEVTKSKKFIFFNQQKILFDPSLSYSYELNKLIERSVENALVRFKTPVITPEILFITILEDNKMNGGKIIRKILGSEINVYLLRYKLLKRLHSEELNIRTEISTNYHYFAYILKTQLSELEFNRLIESKYFELGILFFRNQLIRRIISGDWNTFLANEIHASIMVTSNRTYSS